MICLLDNIKQSNTVKLFNKVVYQLSVHKNLVLYSYAAILCALTFIRVFDSDIWGDEGRVIVQSRLNLDQLINYLASIGHSPFHYVLDWCFVRIFNDNIFIHRLSATSAYFCIVFLGITVIKNCFGIRCATLFITFCSLLKCAIIYNLEIRMYAWCSLFCLLSYLCTYKIYLNKNSIKFYILLALFSALASYTHYFSLACIGILYATLFFYIFMVNKFQKCKDYVYFIASLLIYICLFSPWIMYVKEVKNNVVTNYLISRVPTRECFKFIFFTDYNIISYILCSIWFVFPLILCVLRLYNLIRKRSKSVVKLLFDALFNKSSNNIYYWILVGYVVVIGTILLSQLYSRIYFPITILRYLYVCYILAWLIFAIELSLIIKNKWLYSVIVFVFIVILLPSYTEITKREFDHNNLLIQTLSKTQKEIRSGDVIYTDIPNYFGWTVSGTYYPNVPLKLIEYEQNVDKLIKLPNLDMYKVSFLVLGEPISSISLNLLKTQKRKVNLIVEKGYIGQKDVWIYKVQ